MAASRKEQKCFVIMPVTVPEHLSDRYDEGHFARVLKHLFSPAIEKAGFKLLPPTVTGADLIQAEIIKNLETTELVLCDISALNPNVFFELGCRTALNKSVCYVKDDLTTKIPFDTGVLNHHTYDHDLRPWTLSDEIQALTDHIEASHQRSKGTNKLWEYFGLQSTATAPTDGEPLDLVLTEIRGLRQYLRDVGPERSRGGRPLSGFDIETGIPSVEVKDHLHTLRILARTLEGDPNAPSNVSRRGLSEAISWLTELRIRWPKWSGERDVPELIDRLQRLLQPES